jgi:DNA-binding NtrC family response regulator
MTTPSKKRPILIVDDESEMLTSIRRLLRLEFEVFTAASGAEAIEIMRQQPIHVVMTDQRMPQMTGVEFLRHVRTEYPEVIRLIVTGYAEINAIVEAINEGGVYRYIAKPFEPQGLAALLHEAGAQYDRIVERRQLLTDLRVHEEQFLTLSEELRSNASETLNAEGVARMDQLWQSSQGLLARLGTTLAAPETRPLS